MLQGTGLKPWNPVRNVLKLDEHGQSIFGRKKIYRIKPTSAYTTDL